MMAKTHTALALTLALATIKYGLFGFVALGHGFLSLVFLGALIPDIDHPESTLGRKIPTASRIISKVFGHRGVLHGLFGCAIILAIAYIICRVMFIGSWKLILFALGFGFIAHLVADSFTPKGIKWFHPLGGHVKGPIKTASLTEWAIFIVLIFLIGTFAGSLGFGLFRFV